MFMKTKERENSMGVGREDLTGELPLIIPFPGEEGACEQNPLLPCPVTHVPYPASLKTKVHPAMFMKTKGRENSKWLDLEELNRELPLIIPFPAKWVPVSRIHFSLVLCPISRIPLH